MRACYTVQSLTLEYSKSEINVNLYGCRFPFKTQLMQSSQNIIIIIIIIDFISIITSILYI